MAALTWDNVGEKKYETGVSECALFVSDTSVTPSAENHYTTYGTGVAWNGITGIDESPSGAEANKFYADNIEYANLTSAEEYGNTITAYTYPDEFEACDGSKKVNGISIGMQRRLPFALAYKTKVGNDQDEDAGYKLHLVYGLKASPSQRSYKTINDSPELIEFSWETNGTPVPVVDSTGNVIEVGGVKLKPTCTMTLDTTTLSTQQLTNLATLEGIIYGGTNSNPTMPSPGEVTVIIGATG